MNDIKINQLYFLIKKKCYLSKISKFKFLYIDNAIIFNVAFSNTFQLQINDNTD